MPFLHNLDLPLLFILTWITIKITFFNFNSCKKLKTFCVYFQKIFYSFKTTFWKKAKYDGQIV